MFAPGKSCFQSASASLNKLKGGDQEWRMRVGDDRAVYTIDDAKLLVDVTRIRHSSEEYEGDAAHALHGAK